MIPNGATSWSATHGRRRARSPGKQTARPNKSELTVICNDAGLPGKGVGNL